MTLIKDLTEDYDGEFRVKAAKGLKMISNRKEKIADIIERIDVMRTRIDNLQAEILEILNIEVETLEL